MNSLTEILLVLWKNVSIMFHSAFYVQGINIYGTVTDILVVEE